MRALALTTRFRRGANDEDFCLLAYDEINITSAVISADVRDVFERRPNTSWIYVLAPFQNESDVISAALGGTGFSRAGGRIGVLSYRRRGTANVEVVVLTKGETDSVGIKEAPLPPELQHGWLFDLFDSRRGRVEAPLGVHFGKTSGKHSDKFLRTSGVLLSSVVCAVVAFFSLTSLPVREVRRIFVDTAPLLSVVFSMQRIALQHGFWTQIAPTQSFSSYGGLDELPTLNRNDLVLVSASTSGNLADKLIGKGVADDFLLTLFLLKSTVEMSSPGGVVCDLTSSAPGSESAKIRSLNRKCRSSSRDSLRPTPSRWRCRSNSSHELDGCS